MEMEGILELERIDDDVRNAQNLIEQEKRLSEVDLEKLRTDEDSLEELENDPDWGSHAKDLHYVLLHVIEQNRELPDPDPDPEMVGH
jgi:hypothetical protein